MSRKEKWTVGVLTLHGYAKAGTGVSILLKDADDHAIWCKGTRANLPLAADGYAYGCMYTCTDTGEILTNVGGSSTSNFEGETVSSSSSSSSSSTSS